MTFVMINVLNLKKKQVKCTLVQALRLCTSRTAHRGSRGIALHFLDHGTRRGEVSASRPGRSLPPGKTRYSLYRRLGGPQGRSRRTENLVPPGFDLRTVQPVASRYTDYATRPTFVLNTDRYICVMEVYGGCQLAGVVLYIGLRVKVNQSRYRSGGAQRFPGG